MKNLKYWHLCLAIWLGIASLSCAQNKATFELKEEEKLIEFTTDRFTLPNLHVTPDGESIIFDVLGDIYQVPIEGGKAEVLLQDNNWKRAGKLSPDGKILAYISDETGVFQVWTLNLETKEKRVYPIIESVHYSLSAYWKDKNNLLIPSKEGLWNFEIRAGEEYLLRGAKEEERSIMHATNHKMTINKTASHAYFTFDNILWAYDLNEKTDKYIGEFKEKRKKTLVKVSPNGQKVLYFGHSVDEPNLMQLKYWNLETNIIKSLYTTSELGFSTKLDYSFDFIDDSNIVLDKEGEIVRMNIVSGEYEMIPIKVKVKKIIKKSFRREPQYIKDSIITASVLRNPVTRPGLDTIYFGAFGKLHTYAKNTGDIKEMYPDEDRFEVSPSLSPDGKYLAYTTWNDTKMGHVYTRELHTGKEYQLTKTAGRYINPAWAPDGKEIVFIADETEAKMGIPRQSAGANTHHYNLDLHRIDFFKNNKIQECLKSDVIYRVQPFTNLPRRFYPVPVYNHENKSVFISARDKLNNFAALIEIDLISKDIIAKEILPFNIDEILVSPNANHTAFIFDEKVWVDNYPYSKKIKFSSKSEFIPQKFHYKGGVLDKVVLPLAIPIYEIAPSYIYWIDENTLMWGSAEEVYTHDMRIGETEKIADIKVQRPRAIPKAQYALTNARIITMNNLDEIVEKGTILVNGNRIVAVGEVDKVKVPENYKVFDLEGKTIMPGLIDVHAHYHLFPYEILSQENYAYKGSLAYGVTTIYDPSVNELDYREQAQMIEVGDLLGPRVFASGNIIDESPREYDYKELNNQSDAHRYFKSLNKLKVHGPAKDYSISSLQKRNRLIQSAKLENIGLTAHQSTLINSLIRIKQGYTAIEHEIADFNIQKDVIRYISSSKINYTPTFMVSPRIGDLFLNETIPEGKKLKLLNGEVLFRNNYANYRFNLDSIAQESRSKDLINRKRDIKRAATILKEIEEFGGVVSVGGHGNPLPGIGTHWELWSFTYGGLENYKAIQAATINGAKKLDLHEEIGSIDKGKLADMVVLNCNPLQDIFNTIDIYYTIQNGNIYDTAIMKQIYPIEIEL